MYFLDHPQLNECNINTYLSSDQRKIKQIVQVKGSILLFYFVDKDMKSSLCLIDLTMYTIVLGIKYNITFHVV